MQPEATNRPPSGTIQRRTGATDNSPATVGGERQRAEGQVPGRYKAE